ncbi:hypothetical protein UPYG_G00301420 [Umbra pygmaea]|uniref:AIG1-type G domain-containing protein n=1 Tax=Umbra pygmaea TaxID=75934 RepID=A0ABD0W6H3_UMBPY
MIFSIGLEDGGAKAIGHPAVELGWRRWEMENMEEDIEGKRRDQQVEDINKENYELAQQIFHVKNGVERLRRETSVQNTEHEGTGSTLPVRRRNSMDHPTPEMGGETSDTDHRETPRRRNSVELPPEMTAESSGLVSPVSSAMSEVRLVLLGRSGSGRRAAGNTILGREEFGAQISPSAVTERSVRTEGDVCGRRLVLVDTPDLFCPGFSLEEMRQDVGLCVHLSAPGPHAFLLVIPVETSKEVDRGLLERMEDMFGEGCWGHTVIIFTHDDSLKEQSIEEFLQAGSQDLQQLVEKCGSRYHILNIKDTTHGPQVTELLENVEKMVAGNREIFYSSQTYQEAETQVREMERKIHEEREERKQREEREMRERLDKELQDSLKEKDEVIQKLNEEITSLKEKITDLERQITEERDEEKKRELEREIKRETDRREEMERHMERFREERENERKEMEERHRQQIEEIMENYKGEARDEAERNLMKIVLPELQRNIMISLTKMKSEFSRQMEEKDREIQGKDKQMEEKDRQMEQKKREMEEKDREMEENESVMEEKDRQMEKKDRDILFLVVLVFSLLFAVWSHRYF